MRRSSRPDPPDRTVSGATDVQLASIRVVVDGATVRLRSVAKLEWAKNPVSVEMSAIKVLVSGSTVSLISAIHSAR